MLLYKWTDLLYIDHMPKLVDITGLRFGRLVVIERRPKSHWLCACDCGGSSIVKGANLKNGSTKSCGCISAEKSRLRLLTRDTPIGHKHGKSKTRAYSIWRNMISRCCNRSSPNYPRYGGRGISVDDRWLSFQTFLEDMGDPPDGLTLERIDNDGNYERSNCRWATRLEQAQNRHSPTLKRPRRMVTIDGITKPAGEWYKLLRKR